jgi:glycine cleavage system H lipoate-binding protein
MTTKENGTNSLDENSNSNKSKSTTLIFSLLAIFAIAVILFNVFGTRSYQWQLSLGGDKYEQAYAVAPLSDGGYLTVGVTNSKGAGSNDIWVIKNAANGATQWEKVLGGVEWDIAKSVIEVKSPVSSESNANPVLVFGSTSSTDNGDSDFWLLKLDRQGQLLWQKKYGDSAEEKGQVVLNSADGGYILLGTVADFSTGLNDVLVIKTDSQGEVLWQKTYGDDGSNQVTTAQLTPEGDILFGGQNAVGQYDFWLNKIDSQGNIIWQTTAGTESSDTATDLVINTDGSIVIVGYNISNGTGLRILMAVKFDAQGQELWQKEYRALYNQWSQANAIVASPNGGYVLAGKTKTARQYDDSPHFEPWLLALDENGEKLWDTIHQQSGDHQVNDLQLTQDGGLILVGSRQDQSNQYQSPNTQQKGDNFLIMKMDARGYVK